MTQLLPFLAVASTSAAASAAVPESWHYALLLWTGRTAIVVVMLGMLLCIGRLLRGPHLADRALAVDVVAIQLIGLVILLSMYFGSLVLFDGVLVLSLLGFAGTVAMAQYIGRPHVKRGTHSKNTTEA